MTVDKALNTFIDTNKKLNFNFFLFLSNLIRFVSADEVQAYIFSLAIHRHFCASNKNRLLLRKCAKACSHTDTTAHQYTRAISAIHTDAIPAEIRRPERDSGCVQKLQFYQPL